MQAREDEAVRAGRSTGGNVDPEEFLATFVSAIEAMRDAIAVEDVHGRVVHANAAMVALLGVTRRDHPGVGLESILRPSAIAAYRDWRAAGEERASCLPCEAILPGGEHARIELVTTELVQGDRVVGYQTMARRIAPGEWTADDFRRSHERLANLIDILPLPVNVLDSEARVIMWNRAAERLFGWKASEIVGKVYPLAPGPMSGQHRRVLERSIREGRVYSGFQTTRFRRDGTPVQVSIWSVPLRDVHGKVRASLGVLIDDTARSRAEADYRRIFDGAHDAIVIFEPENEIVLEVNARACEVYGFEYEEFVGMSLASVSKNVERGRERIGAILEERATEDFETVHRRKDGTEMSLEVNASVVQYRGQDAIMCINRDITPRRRLERELRQSQKMEALGQLAGGVAHDFNNILTIIGTSTQLIEDRADDEELLADTREIRAAAERGRSLTQQLLAFSRKRVARPEVMDPVRVLRKMAGWIDPLLGDNVSLVTDLDTAGANVYMDPVQFEQVVLNLVLNARDAMPDGGTISMSCKRTGPEAGAFVRLMVSDSGVGMDEDTQGQIFTPFFTTKPVGKGTGLGLSTAYGIVRQAGGEIAVRSELGEGTTFLVDLPRTTEAPRARPRAPERLERGTGHILLVEDDEAVRRAARRALAAAGYEVEAVADAEAAESVLETRGDDFEVLISDVQLPGKGGGRLALEQSEARPHLRVLMISGNVGDDPADHAPALPLLEKPFSGAQLTAVVRSLLAESRGPPPEDPDPT